MLSDRCLVGNEEIKCKGVGQLLITFSHHLYNPWEENRYCCSEEL